MTGIVDLIKEIYKCHEADATLAQIALCYMCIDAMAYVSMPKNKRKNTGQDFIDWVDKYLESDPIQPYQYSGKDLWAARCSYLHTFSASADYHDKHPDVVKIIYHIGNSHGFDPVNAPGYALLEISTFSNDVVSAVQKFLKEMNDNSLNRKIYSERLNAFFSCYPTSN
jgi:hypothetical protein